MPSSMSRSPSTEPETSTCTEVIGRGPAEGLAGVLDADAPSDGDDLPVCGTGCTCSIVLDRVTWAGTVTRSGAYRRLPVPVDCACSLVDVSQCSHPCE